MWEKPENPISWQKRMTADGCTAAPSASSAIVETATRSGLAAMYSCELLQPLGELFRGASKTPEKGVHRLRCGAGGSRIGVRLTHVRLLFLLDTFR